MLERILDNEQCLDTLGASNVCRLDSARCGILDVNSSGIDDILEVIVNLNCNCFYKH